MKNPSAVTFRGHLPVILFAKRKGSEDVKQILIVEDDSFLNKMLAYNLTADGYGVTCPKCQNRSRRHPPAGI